MVLFTDGIRQSLRNLARSPLFTLVALLTLALGIGATTAIYSAVDAVLLRALPYPQGERLVALWADAEQLGMPRQEWTNPADFTDWEAGLSGVEAMAAYTGWSPTLTGAGDPVQLQGAQVTWRYFEVLGVAPLLGRAFTAEEDQPNGPAVAVVSHGFWRERLGGAAELGQRVVLNDVPHTVIGVMPPGFASPLLADRQVWRPLQAVRSEGRGGFWLRTLARLKPGVTLAAAQAEFSALQQQLAARYPDSNAKLGGYVQPLHELVGQNLQRQLWVLLAATALVLAIACANLANLLMARASDRQRELAVRASLGASSGHIARQLLTESCLLSLGGASVGLLLAFSAVRWIGSVLPPEVAQVAPLAIDLRVAGFTAALAITCGLLFGAAPAMHAARPDLSRVLRHSERGSASVGATRLRAGLVVVTFALALALCVGAGLFLKSLWKLQHVDPGFSSERALSFSVQLPAARYADADALRRAQAALEQRLIAVPGVQRVGLTSSLPLAENNTDAMVYLEGALQRDAAKRMWYSQVSPGYLETMGVPLRAGRGFAATDRNGAPRVLIVNQAFADAYFPGRSPVGARVASNPENPQWLEIVGVVGDVRFFGLQEAQTPAGYLVLEQSPASNLYIVVRAAGEPTALLPALRQAIADVDPLLAIGPPLTLQARIDQALRPQRLVAGLTGGFAALALLLAALGVYGVVAYSVSTRQREFGVRMALGASARQLLRSVLAGGLRLALAGVAVGGLLAFALSRLIASLLFEVQPFDAGVLLGVAALLFAVALLASLLPALRALRIHPNVSLRYE